MSIEENMCPKCNSPYAYPDGLLWICPECAHEWVPGQTSDTPSEDAPRFLDAYGNPLQDGDTVTTIKDLKTGKDTMKLGTRVKNIKLLDNPVNDHDISCKVAGFGAMYLKCSVVKKA
jgi:protein PhnA